MTRAYFPFAVAASVAAQLVGDWYINNDMMVLGVILVLIGVWGCVYSVLLRFRNAGYARGSRWIFSYLFYPFAVLYLAALAPGSLGPARA